MRQWFENLQSISPAYDYFPEPSKTILVVQSSDLLMANDLFHDLGIKVITGSHFLGGLLEISRWRPSLFLKKCNVVSLRSPTF